jgi:hypothetical protein
MQPPCNGGWETLRHWREAQGRQALAVRLCMEGNFEDGDGIFADLQQFILQILQSQFFVLQVLNFQLFRKLYLALTSFCTFWTCALYFPCGVLNIL